MSASGKDHYYMTRALKLAEKGLYSTHPNPRVGCVVVNNDAIVGEGWHERAGQPHAEVLALRRAGDAARGACVYVNLEPCCHQGRTPPCTGYLVDAGIRRVVAAMEDPNPQVGGGGIDNLRSAGIDVDVGVMRPQAEALNLGFVKRLRWGRPWVTLKTAASIDGRTAMASGESRWISSAQARRDVHHWRARSSAVLTGSGTVLADDPSLTAREVATDRQPLRVIVDSRFSTPLNARVLSGPGEVLVATASENHIRSGELEAAGVEVVHAPNADGGVDLNVLLEHLSQREINEVLVEAGPTLSGAMLQAGLVDEMLIYLAPAVIGNRGRGMFDLTGVEELGDRMTFDIFDLRQFGPDLRIRLRPRQPC